METMTSENIYRIEITETNLPAKVVKKEVNVPNRTTTLTKETGMGKMTKTIICFKPNKHTKTKKRRRVIISDSDWLHHFEFTEEFIYTGT